MSLKENSTYLSTRWLLNNGDLFVFFDNQVKLGVGLKKFGDSNQNITQVGVASMPEMH